MLFVGFSSPKYINGKNNSFKDSDLDQSIFEIKAPKDLIAFCGFRILKKVPTIALLALLILFNSGTISAFRESINGTTLWIKVASFGMSFKAFMITLSKAPFSFTGIMKRYVSILFGCPNESEILLFVHCPAFIDRFSNELLIARNYSVPR